MKEWDKRKDNDRKVHIQAEEFEAVHHVINLIGDKYLRTKLTEKLLGYHPDQEAALAYMQKKRELEELKKKLKL